MGQLLRLTISQCHCADRAFTIEAPAPNLELRATNLELRATNLELRATNPELPATNPELPATNPELPATNLELRGVAEELHAGAYEPKHSIDRDRQIEIDRGEKGSNADSIRHACERCRRPARVWALVGLDAAME